MGCVGIFNNDLKLRKPSILKAEVIRKRAFDLVRRRLLYHALFLRLTVFVSCAWFLLVAGLGMVGFSNMELTKIG